MSPSPRAHFTLFGVSPRRGGGACSLFYATQIILVIYCIHYGTDVFGFERHVQAASRCTQPFRLVRAVCNRRRRIRLAPILYYHVNIPGTIFGVTDAVFVAFNAYACVECRL